MNKKHIKLISSIALAICIIIGVVLGYKETGELDRNEINKAINVIEEGITTYNMTNEEVKDLPSSEIIEQTEEEIEQTGEEQNVTEEEGFLLQGDIAYNGDNEFPNISVGNYAGLTYYSQIDSRWRNHPYTSVGNASQTIGSSGCGPTSAAMVVTSIKGVITPDTMGDLFVQHGYRSADNGTYFSAFRWVADTFKIDYQETYRLNDAVDLLRKNNLIVCSVGNGLFTTGGHFIVLVGIDGDMIKIYDPYLYAGKFETSTRRGKVTVSGNTVYCSIDNFREYANYTKFFAYQNTNTQENNEKPVVTESYTRTVKANGGLNVRDNPEGNRIGGLANGIQVTVEETSGNWSRISNPVNGWVCSTYLYTSRDIGTINTVGQVKKLTKATTLYSNSNLTGTAYNYKANTTITILENVSSNVDKIRVNVTGRIAYIDNSNYTKVTVSNARGTVGQFKRLRTTTYLYSNANLTGTKYTYLPQTQVKIVRNISNNIDYVYVVKTGRYAYVNTNNYK